MMTRRNWMAVLLVLTAAALTCGLEAEQSSSGLVGPSATCDVYAAVNGTATAVGSQAQPWDLQTALKQPPALTSGMTLCLRGGTYTGGFASFIKGTAGNPITIRSAPGEWAVIDGYMRATLTANITPVSKTIAVDDASGFPTNPEPYGHVQVSIGKDSFFIKRRGVGHTLDVEGGISENHSIGDQIIGVDVALELWGAYVTVRDFEVKSSDPIRDDFYIRSRMYGVELQGPGHSIINMVIHDLHHATGNWEAAVDSVMSGNILFNNGVGVNNTGHASYIQNVKGRKLFRDNIMFGNWGYGPHMFKTNPATQTGVTFDGNVSVNDRWLIGGYAPLDDITITNNFIFGAELNVGYKQPQFGHVTVSGNYVYAVTPFNSARWDSMTVTNNKFWMSLLQETSGPSGVVVGVVMDAAATLANYTFANNDYLSARTWNGGPFRHIVGTLEKFRFFDDWRTLTNDSTSTYRGATQQNKTIPVPTGVDIFYRANPYEEGRGHVIIYNHDVVASVTVDLSKVGLTIGQSYQIRNGQNFLAAPIVTGYYDGTTVTVPLNTRTVAQPLTNNGRVTTETPHFAVLVVIPMSPPPPPPLMVAMTEARYYTVSGPPPDNSGGWSVQFKYGEVNFGSVYASAPYTHTALLPMASYTFTGVWTKPGQPTVITQPFVIEVK